MYGTDSTGDFKLLESIGLFNGQYFILDYHLQRIRQAAVHFDFQIDLNAIQAALNTLVHQHSTGDWKVRLLVNRNGIVELEAASLSSLPSTLKVQLAEQPIDSACTFLYYKTTNRTIYEQHKHKSPDIFDTLLWNRKRELTEFTTGNIVIEINDSLYTPPVTCGLLNGTFRQQLIEEKRIIEEIIPLTALSKCTNIWLINSVRRWVSVKLL